MGGQRLTMLALAALLPLAARAEEQGGGTAACRADAQKFCASASNKKECLIDHQQEISDGCYDFLKKLLSQKTSAGDAPAAPAPIYKYKDAEGRIVYTNAAVPNAAEVRDRMNGALPMR